MDQERERIQQDLRGLLDGDVFCDDLFVQLYASDASIYEVRPLGVVRARGLHDVVACVQYAAEHNIPVFPRGAGTGVAGESLGPGLVIDFSYHMRRLIEVGEDTVRVQPGLVLAQLNKQLARTGRLFGPDPSTRSVTTMGSVIALDGGGSHWLKYGSARGRVVSLQVVLADGSVIDAVPTPLPSPAATAVDDQPRRTELVRRLGALFQREASVIEAHRPQAPVDRAGYRVHDVLVDGELDLPRLLVGSEGTLGLVTEAVLKTDPLPRHRGVMLLFFDRLDAAAQGALLAADMGVSACDLLDRRLLTISREVDVRFDLLIPAGAEAMLLVEVDGDAQVEVRDRLHQLASQIQRRKRLAFDARMAMDAEERNLFWHLVRRVVPRLYRLKGSTRPLPFIEDIAIPPETLPAFLVTMQNVLKENQVTATVFAHAGHGQLHIRPFLDIENDEDVRRMPILATQMYDEVLKVGGTISGEHGEGLSRTWFGRRQHGLLYDVFREIKRIFDPLNILNPGKIVADAPPPLTKSLRPAVGRPAVLEPTANGDAATPRPRLELQLVWKEEDIGHTARSCNGCGRCRTLGDAERMCPIFRFAPREEASPRAKGNLMRAVLNGKLDVSLMATDQMKAIADLCVHCHQCRLECPANVDIPKLMVECKSQFVVNNGLRPSDLILARPELLSMLASRVRRFSNWAIGNPQMRWLLDKFLGIAPGRKLPRFAPRSFLRVAQRRKLSRPARHSGKKVLFFVDQYANWHDVQLAEALVMVLEHNGVSVFVPARQLPSGMPAVAFGAVETAKRVAAHNVQVLADAVRQGYQVVTAEPSAALCLKHEYPNLLDEDDVRLVAANTSEACTYLWRLHQSGKLKLDFKPVNASLGYHQPCHLRALGVGSPGELLLRLIPGLNVQRLDHGCSGMAGAFGLRHKNYRSSLRAGWGLISALRDPAIQCGTSECSTCKIQMEQGTTKPTIHPLKMLALSYGLMPDVARLLTVRGEELIVT